MQLAARPGAARLHSGRAGPKQQQQQQHVRQRRRASSSLRASASRQDADAASTGPATTTATTTPSTTNPRLDCIEVGMDVYCVIDDSSGTNANSTTTAAADDASASASFLATPFARAALLVSPFFFWGTSMVAMKGVGPHATPLLLGAMRLLPAGLALVLWAARQGRPQPAGLVAWGWVSLFALVDGAAFQAFLAQGLERTSAGLGSVIIDSQPLSVAVLAALLFGERLGPLGVGGLALGVLGLLLLEVPPSALPSLLGGGAENGSGAALLDLASSSSSATALSDTLSDTLLTNDHAWSLLDSGEFWMLLAAQSMAVGTVMVRYVTKHCDPVMATGYHMVLGGSVLLAGALLTGGDDLPLRLSEFSAQDALAMLYVSMLGGAASYGVFFLEASRGNLTRLSSLTFLTPMFAAAGDYVVRGATLTPLQLLGAGVALGGVAMVSGGSKGAEEKSDKAA